MAAGSPSLARSTASWPRAAITGSYPRAARAFSRKARKVESSSRTRTRPPRPTLGVAAADPAVAAGPAAGARALVAPPAASPVAGETSAPAIEAARTGRSNVNAAPRPQGDGANRRSPPCDRTIACDTDRPSPLPSSGGLVLKNASNSRSTCSGATPRPSSTTVMRTRSSGPGCPSRTALIPILRPAARANGLDRVAGQVDEHLLDLATIELDRREVVGDIDLDLDRAGTKAARLQGEHAVDQGADGRRAPLRRAVGQEIQQVAGDVLGPLGFRRQQLRVVPKVLRQGRIAADELAEADDRRQRIAELVRDSRCQAAGHLHLLRCDHLSLEAVLVREVADAGQESWFPLHQQQRRLVLRRETTAIAADPGGACAERFPDLQLGEPLTALAARRTRRSPRVAGRAATRVRHRTVARPARWRPRVCRPAGREAWDRAIPRNIARNRSSAPITRSRSRKFSSAMDAIEATRSRSPRSSWSSVSGRSK